MLTVVERVQNGIEWLESIGMNDWRNRVRVLDIRMPCSCVLGWCFGGGGRFAGNDFESGWKIARELHHLSDDDLVDMGFDANQAWEFSDLQDEWLKRIHGINCIQPAEELKKATLHKAICQPA